MWCLAVATALLPESPAGGPLHHNNIQSTLHGNNISCRRPPAPQQHSVHTPWQQHLLQEAPCTTTTFSPHSMATTSPAGGPLHHNNIQSTLHGNNISCRRPPAPQQHSVHTPWQQHLLQEAPCTTTTFSPHSMATTSPAGGPLHHNNIQSTLHGNNISCRRPPAPQQHSVHTPWQQHLLQEAPCTTTTFSPHSMATTSCDYS